MAKTKLSILLIKEGINQEQVIKNGTPYMDLRDGNKLYYKVMPARSPKWVESFFGDTIPANNPLKGRSVSAVILYDIEIAEGSHRIFAVCFGHGRSLLHANAMERRFGLITTLSAVDPNHLRSIDVNTLDSIPLNSRVQSSNLASIENFNIDIEKDLLKSVVGKSEVENVEGLLSGTDSLSLSTENTYDNMSEMLRNCYDLYKSDRYRTNFEWVDQIQAIKDKELVEQLDNEMLTKLKEDDVENIWFSVPEIIDWDVIDCFKLKSEKRYDDIDVNILKTEYPENLRTIKKLKSNHVKCIDTDDNIKKKWPVYRCIYADITYERQQYLLNDGKWFKVDTQFAEKINDNYNKISVCPLPLPKYTHENEEKYNKAVSDTEPEKYFLMDRKLIIYGGNKIEFCDLYSSDRQIIHVKKYTGSSVLSHLFMQGIVSAESFLDNEFRQLVNQKMADDFFVPINPDEFSTSDFEVVYVIAGNKVEDDGRPHIPFFSKVSLNAVVKRLQRLKYKVSIKGIRLNQN